MIYIETGSTDVYYNFGLEYYFTLEKRLPETVFLFRRTTPTLMGCPYERGAVLASLRSHGIDGAVYRISAEELASVVVD